MPAAAIVLLSLAGVVLIAFASRGAGWSPAGAGAAGGVVFGIGLGIGSNVSGIVLAVYAALLAVLVIGMGQASRRAGTRSRHAAHDRQDEGRHPSAAPAERAQRRT